MFRLASILSLFLLCAALGLAVVSCGGSSESQRSPEAVKPLRIGLLVNFRGDSGRSAERQQSFEMAIKHINEGGGVFGLPVEGVSADSTLVPETAVSQARRLTERLGVHALVGPPTSATALQVVEQVSGPARIPTVSFGASSPLLSDADDQGFFFRTTPSDSVQGGALAKLTRERGFDNISLIHRNDAWGKGLSDSFREEWTGNIQVAAFEPGSDTFLPQLEQLAGEGSQALVVIAFNTARGIIIREAQENNLFSQFALGDAVVSEELLAAAGGEIQGEVFGTTGAREPSRASALAWEQAYIQDYGFLPKFSYAKECYDAAIAIALAAQAAGSTEGHAIREQLHSIDSEPGELTMAGPKGVAEALRILREGGAVDYDGAAGTMDWDDRGDLRRGHVLTWQYTGETGFEELALVAFDY